MEDDDMDSLFEGMVLFNPPSSSSSSSQLPLQSSSSLNNNTTLVTNNNNNNDNVIELLPNNNINDNYNQHQPPPESPTPATTTTAGAQFEPLDENLFSDLTLLVPPLPLTQNDDVSSDNHPPISPSSSSTSSRSTTFDAATSASVSLASPSPSQTSVAGTRSLTSQISSTRKKKKAGLRIGYGRSAVQSHDSAVDVDDSQPTVSSPVVVSEEKSAPVEEKAGLMEAQQEKQAVSESEISTESNVTEAMTAEVEEQVSMVKDVPNGKEEEVTPVEIKEDSIEMRYDRIKQQIAEKLNRVREAVVSVSVKRKEVIRKRRKAAEELNRVSTKYKEMEKELEEAVESEDFETAERVSDGLASAEKNKEDLLIVLRDAEAECDDVDSKMQEALELQIVAEEECAALLKGFAVDADHDADFVISIAQTKTSEEMEKWYSLSEALEVKKMEVEIESHVLSGARQVLDDSIEHVVKDDKEESQLLHNKKKILAEELQELLDLVKQKEAEISENDLNIENVEKRVAEAVSSFHEAQTKIHSKSENLQMGLSQLDLENDDLARKKKDIDDFLLQEETRGSKIKELGKLSTDEAHMYQEVIHLRKTLIEFISKSQEDKARLAKTEQKLFDDIQMLKQDISAVRTSLQDLSSMKSGSQQTIESSKQRLLYIEKRVPEIESEKRVAATARNFKEAARIANEAKALYVEKETLQIRVDEAMSELKKMEDDINQNVEKLQEKEQNISLMEKELESVRYQRLILLAGAAMAERSAAIELGDMEEADILLKEAQTAEVEAKKIQKTHKEDEFESIPKSFIAMELVSTLDKKQLAELAASTQMGAP
uniref:protein CROWDED NUCLEI 1 n=1 Tax=Erigeron canadensis TaxID=72917 RepID=UPI001CB95BBC|nr:protein CROWDED NUCLEI 1 [Erigeron canadensis]